MIYLIATILFVLWMSGLVTVYTLTGLAHVFLVVAVAIMLLRFISRVRAS